MVSSVSFYVNDSLTLSNKNTNDILFKSKQHTLLLAKQSLKRSTEYIYVYKNLLNTGLTYNKLKYKNILPLPECLS